MYKCTKSPVVGRDGKKYRLYTWAKQRVRANSVGGVLDNNRKMLKM